MSVEMPDKIALDMPPGDPSAVDAVERDLGGVAFHLHGVADALTGPAAAAPGWLGADAAAAETQVVRIAGIVREAAVAVRSASRRLSSYGDLLRATRREVAALREEQDEDYRRAWQRLGQVQDPQLAVMTGSPAWVGVVDDFRASEAARRRRHALAFEELADDAAATSRELEAAARPVGGTGRAGDGGRVLAHLAAELPGWGVPELTHRGRALADALMGSLLPEERVQLALDALPLAGHPAFATAFLREAGEEELGLLLEVLGTEPDGPDHPLAAVLATALGSAVPSGRRGDRVAVVLDATYARSDDRYGATARIAGMAAVLSAGTRAAGGGPRMATVGAWARQLLLRERGLDMPTALVSAATAWPDDARDPVQLAVGILGQGRDPAAASALLGDERVWEELLDRFWGDGGAALRALVAEAGRDTGAAGDRAVRLGLETIGAGLVEGDPSDRTVNRDVVAAVAPALGGAVAAHVDVAAGALASLATGGGGEVAANQVKGLGQLTVDRPAAAAIEGALQEWVAGRSWDVAGTDAAHPLPEIAVAAAYVAAQEYGQRLAYALDGFELQEAAEARERWWNWTGGWILEVASFVPARPVGLAADVAGAVVPKLFGMDGTFDQGADDGRRYDRDDAVDRALAGLTPGHVAVVDAVEAQASAAHRRTAQALGIPVAPESKRNEWSDVVLDIATDGLTGAATDDLRDRAGRRGASTPFVDLLPGRR